MNKSHWIIYHLWISFCFCDNSSSSSCLAASHIVSSLIISRLLKESSQWHLCDRMVWCSHHEAESLLPPWNIFDPFRVTLNLIGEKTSYQETGPKNFPVTENLFFHRMHFKYNMTMNIIEVRLIHLTAWKLLL